MENLPLEITSIILSSVLPMRSRLLCREVCTTWRTLLAKPKRGLIFGVPRQKGTNQEAEFYFSEQKNHKVSTSNVSDDDEEQLSCVRKLTQYDHSLIMQPSPDIMDYRCRKNFIVGSCNGLVCYASFIQCEKEQIYVCNPVTGEQNQVPVSNWEHRHSYLDWAIGFGYDSSSNEYKVVRILSCYCRPQCRDKVIMVHTLNNHGGGTWRNKESNTIKHRHLTHSDALPSPGVLVCGALHWIDEWSKNPKIIAFDLKHETYELLRISVPFVGVNDTKHVALMKLGGNLCVLEVVPNTTVMIWESSKYTMENRDVDPWVLKFSVPWEYYMTRYDQYSLRSVKRFGKCLLWYNAIFSCYDPETKTLRKLHETLKDIVHGCTCTHYIYNMTRATPHMNSLVSLEGMVKEERCGKKRKAPEETGEESVLATY